MVKLLSQSSLSLLLCNDLYNKGNRVWIQLWYYKTILYDEYVYCLLKYFVWLDNVDMSNNTESTKYQILHTISFLH